MQYGILHHVGFLQREWREEYSPSAFCTDRTSRREEKIRNIFVPNVGTRLDKTFVLHSIMRLAYLMRTGQVKCNAPAICKI